jgi:hypothetical protein
MKGLSAEHQGKRLRLTYLEQIEQKNISMLCKASLLLPFGQKLNC